MKLLNVLATMALLLTTGCASFKANEVPPTTYRELPSGFQKKTVGYTFSYTQRSRSTPAQRRQNEMYYGKLLETELQESGYFSAVSWGRNNQDVLLDIALDRKGRPTAAALLTAASFSLIPSWNTNSYALHVRAEKQSVPSTIDLRDGSTDVAWFLLFPVGLAAESDPEQTPDQIISNLYRAAIKALMEDE
jgi:hypothetical protein